MTTLSKKMALPIGGSYGYKSCTNSIIYSSRGTPLLMTRKDLGVRAGFAKFLSLFAEQQATNDAAVRSGVVLPHAYRDQVSLLNSRQFLTPEYQHHAAYILVNRPSLTSSKLSPLEHFKMVHYPSTSFAVTHSIGMANRITRGGGSKSSLECGADTYIYKSILWRFIQSILDEYIEDSMLLTSTNRISPRKSPIITNNAGVNCSYSISISHSLAGLSRAVEPSARINGRRPDFDTLADAYESKSSVEELGVILSLLMLLRSMVHSGIAINKFMPGDRIRNAINMLNTVPGPVHNTLLSLFLPETLDTSRNVRSGRGLGPSPSPSLDLGLGSAENNPLLVSSFLDAKSSPLPLFKSLPVGKGLFSRKEVGKLIPAMNRKLNKETSFKLPSELQALGASSDSVEMLLNRLRCYRIASVSLRDNIWGAMGPTSNQMRSVSLGHALSDQEDLLRKINNPVVILLDALQHRLYKRFGILSAAPSLFLGDGPIAPHRAHLAPQLKPSDKTTKAESQEICDNVFNALYLGTYHAPSIY